MRDPLHQFLQPARALRLVILASLAMLVTAAALAGPNSEANPPSPSSTLHSRYQQERAVCTSGRSNQDRATCLREAGAAYAEAKRGGLDGAGATASDNQRKRCEPLTGDERSACLARMQGQGVTSGSAQSGGILRELVVREPASAKAATASASTASSP